jgi:hypothetical protein
VGRCSSVALSCPPRGKDTCAAIPVGAGDDTSRQETLGATVEDHQGLVVPQRRGEVVPIRSLVVTKGSRSYNDTSCDQLTKPSVRNLGTKKAIDNARIGWDATARA